MEGTMQKSATAELLGVAYKTVKSATESLLNLMPKVKSDGLKSDMTVQLSALEAFASRAAKLLSEEGVKPMEEGIVTKVSSKMGMLMGTMRDSTSTHLAEMMVEGATMGVNDMLKQIRESENTSASESAIRLARDVCSYEEKTVNDLRDAYLRSK